MSVQFTTPNGTIILPNYKLGDGQTRLIEVQLNRSMNNEVYTHVKKGLGHYRFNYTFELTHIKALELLEFFKNNTDEIWRMSVPYQYGLYYNLRIVADSLELNNFKRSVYENHSQESITISLTFEGA
jgi:hypothetical protein